MTESAGSAEPKHPIGSVDNAIRLLLLLRDRPAIRVSEASEELGVAQSTAHRLLAMFEHYGLVQKNLQAKSYSPGPTLLTLGLSVVRHDLRAQLSPIIRSLVALADETCSLLALEGVDTIFLDAVECDRPVRTTSRVGLVRPANCTSGGKALLAELSNEEVMRRYPHEQIPGVTEFSLRSRTALLVDLERIREQGYAVGNRENEPDIWAIARVVHAPDGSGVCALSLSCPIQRYTPEKEAELAALLAGAVARAEALSR